MFDGILVLLLMKNIFPNRLLIGIVEHYPCSPYTNSIDTLTLFVAWPVKLYDFSSQSAPAVAMNYPS
jgi:hypothetical protein